MIFLSVLLISINNCVLSVKLKADAPVTLKQCDRKHPVRNSSHYCLCILHIGRNSRQFMQIKTQAVLKQI